MPTTSSRTSTEPSDERRSRTALAAWLVLAAIQISLAFAATRGGTIEDPLFEWEIAIGGTIVYGLVVALSFAVAAAFRDPVGALGFRRFKARWLAVAAGVVVLSIAVAVALEPLLHAAEEQGLAPDEWREDRLWAFVANSVVVVLIGPFAEEVFFRGLGVPALAVLGPIGAVVGTAVVFGLAHGLLVALPPLVVFGLGLAWIRLRSGSVWPGFAAHSVYNGIGIAAAVASL